jgi:hypothetical protein
MKYYSKKTKKMNEILSYETTLKELKIVMLRVISQAQEEEYQLVSLVWKLKTLTLWEISRRMVVTKGWGELGEEEQGSVTSGKEVIVSKKEIIVSK